MGRRIIGLTGGVGMGKSTVSNYLARRLPVLDADLYARDAVALGSPILAAIADRYGADLLLTEGTLDRRRLGEIIFSDAVEKRWLEQQIHPYVRDRISSELQRLSDQPIVVVVVPLLFEAQMTDLVTEIWVVRSDGVQQQQRMIERDRLTPEQAQIRIDSQMPIAQKIAQADVVLDNSTTLESLYQQVDRALMPGERNEPFQ
ncbi:MAG: dephospho-CoA kinase [Oscillatoriophycideae cyanobacterium NC_groundwater_1537_Pr4_S-0.65um_50_18]|nr:dephospho-CoA kinase [Oscillatoriophycideae cyanobacterium NC_groundwater_1537_Pr4_S-0.65um_50_18]